MNYSADIANFIDELRNAALTSNGFVLELGPAKGDGSTLAFMEGLELRGGTDRLFLSVDHQDYMESKPTVPYWHMVMGDSRSIGTMYGVRESTDRHPGILFIDTHHTYDQMAAELPVWFQLADRDTVFLFHDTWMLGRWNDMNRAIIDFANSHQDIDGGWKFEDYRSEPHGLGRMRWVSHSEVPAPYQIPPHPKINAGSGQRRFNPSCGWVNIDINPTWDPDIVASWNDLSMFADGTVDYVVSHHSYEHDSREAADQFTKEAYRVLRPGGSLLIFVPDPRALCQRFLTGQLTEDLFMVNIFGADMGHPADTHKWLYSYDALKAKVGLCAPWSTIRRFDGRSIPGADLAADWWILPVEAIK